MAKKKDKKSGSIKKKDSKKKELKKTASKKAKKSSSKKTKKKSSDKKSKASSKKKPKAKKVKAVETTKPKTVVKGAESAASTEKSINFNATVAVQKIRTLKTIEALKTFTRGEKRVTVKRAIQPAINRLNRK